MMPLRSSLDYETRPLCRRCSDMLFIRNNQGEIVPCDCCCCARCGRPVYLHPEMNGCMCASDQPFRLIVNRSLTVRIVNVEES